MVFNPSCYVSWKKGKESGLIRREYLRKSSLSVKYYNNPHLLYKKPLFCNVDIAKLCTFAA